MSTSSGTEIPGLANLRKTTTWMYETPPVLFASHRWLLYLTMILFAGTYDTIV